MMSWEIDPFHSLAEFSVQHLKISTIRGQFPKVHGTIELDSKYPERSLVKAEISVDSVQTGAPQRDVHLRTADFFDVSRYPTIKFESTLVRHLYKNRFVIGGNLSLHGVTRPVQLQALYTGFAQDMLTDAWRIGLHAKTAIDRRDFGMTYNQNKAGIVLVSNEVFIDLIIEAILMS